MTPQHTPGPWIWTDGENPIDIATYEAPGHYENPRLFGGPDSNTWIAGDNEYWTFGPIGPQSEAIANCHLIAAAPDLLAALEELCLAPNKHRPDEYWKAARAAIAKANGQ